MTAIGRKNLTQCERRGILGVGASDFDDGGKLRLFCRQRGNERIKGGQHSVMNHAGGGNVHGGGKGIVGGLTHVAMVIGMDGVFAAARSPQRFNGKIADDLIHVHVGLRA